LQAILNDLNHKDSSNLVIIDDEVEQWATEFQPRGKVPAAIEYVKKLRDDGGTNINDAMLEAIRQFEGSLSRLVVHLFSGKVRTGDTVTFLTDGQATSGVTSSDTNESVTFELTYQDVLQRVHGVYKHTVNIATKQVKQ